MKRRMVAETDMAFSLIFNAPNWKKLELLCIELHAENEILFSEQSPFFLARKL